MYHLSNSSHMVPSRSVHVDTSASWALVKSCLLLTTLPLPPTLPPPTFPKGPFQISVSLCQQGSLEESLEAAGGVSSNIVEAFRAVLQDSSLDGAFVSAAITLPASTELRDDIPNLNPLLLYQVR